MQADMNIFQVDFESISALVVKQAIDNPIITTSQIKGDLTRYTSSLRVSQFGDSGLCAVD
ncbi:MAG: hypothetical protein ACYTXI_30515 [Nostoc sp.]